MKANSIAIPKSEYPYVNLRFQHLANFAIPHSKFVHPNLRGLDIEAPKVVHEIFKVPHLGIKPEMEKGSRPNEIKAQFGMNKKTTVKDFAKQNLQEETGAENDLSRHRDEENNPGTTLPFEEQYKEFLRQNTESKRTHAEHLDERHTHEQREHSMPVETPLSERKTVVRHHRKTRVEFINQTSYPSPSTQFQPAPTPQQPAPAPQQPTPAQRQRRPYQRRKPQASSSLNQPEPSHASTPSEPMDEHEEHPTFSAGANSRPRAKPRPRPQRKTAKNHTHPEQPQAQPEQPQAQPEQPQAQPGSSSQPYPKPENKRKAPRTSNKARTPFLKKEKTLGKRVQFGAGTFRENEANKKNKETIDEELDQSEQSESSQQQPKENNKRKAPRTSNKARTPFRKKEKTLGKRSQLGGGFDEENEDYKKFKDMQNLKRKYGLGEYVGEKVDYFEGLDLRKERNDLLGRLSGINGNSLIPEEIRNRINNMGVSIPRGVRTAQLRKYLEKVTEII